MAVDVGITLRVDGKTGTLRVAEKEVGKLGKGLTSAGKKARASAKGFDQLGSSIGGLIAVGSVIAFFKEAVQAASALQETQAKFETVFRQNVEQAEDFAKNLVENFNVSENAAKSYLASIQDTLVPMGLSRQAAADLSNEIVQLAADIGSFNDLPTETVVRDLQSALVGNTETVKKFGVVLKATDIAQRAMADSGKTVASELTNAEKVTAAYKLILEGTEDAQGDVARTSDSFANSMKRLQANLQDTTADIGKGLIPAIASLSQRISGTGDLLRNIGLSFAGIIGTVLVNISTVVTTWGTAANGALNTATDLFNGLISLQRTLGQIVIALFNRDVDEVKRLFKEGVQTAIEDGKTLAETVKTAGKDTADSAKKGVEDLIEVWTATFGVLAGLEEESAEQRKQTDDKATDDKIVNAQKLNDIKKQLALEIIELEQGKFEADRVRLDQEILALEEKGIREIEIKTETIDKTVSLEEIKAQKLKTINDAEQKEKERLDKRKSDKDKKDRSNRIKLATENVKTTTDSLETILTATTSSSRKQAEIAKAASIGNAIRSTFEGATKALAQGGAIFGPVMAAIVIAAGLANVSKIQATPLAKGGRVKRPTLAIIGEGGEPETVVPDSKAESFAQAVLGAGARSGRSGEGATVTFGDINITIESVDLNDPTAMRAIMQGLAEELKNETQEAILMARRSSDLNESNADKAV